MDNISKKKEEPKTELQKRDILRLSNEETNRITRECIQTALILLMGEKPFSKITITELTKRSGVSRTAFYRNFSSKEDVLSDIFNYILRTINELVVSADKEKNPTKLYSSIFKLIKDNSKSIDILLKADLGSNKFLDINYYIAQTVADINPSTRYIVLGWWAGVQNIVLDWYSHGMKESITDMAKLCTYLFNNFSTRSA